MRPLPLCALAAAVLLSPAAADEPKKPAKKDDLKLSADEKAVLELTNKERKAAGLAELKPNPTLLKMARDYSKVMAEHKKLGHDVGGKKFEDRIKESGYPFKKAGENVGEGYATPKEAVQGWMDSPPHKKNLLNEDFTEIGVAVAKAEDGTRYWTQVFAAPRGD